jgi:hypothetical protein
MAAPSPVQASCRELDLAAIPRTGDLVVLTGTVLAAAPGRTDLAVDAWFAGPVPRRTVTVLGGLVQPGAITSADWMPTIGERYLVVATARPDGSIVTAPCQQVPADAAVLATARRVFGGSIQPTAGPQLAGESATNLLPIAILIVFVLAAATGLFLRLWARRARTA